MSSLSAIAGCTFREAVRDRIVYAFLLFACLASVAAILLGTLSIGQELRVVKDAGLFVITVIALIVSIFSGTSLVYKEIELKTIYLIFSKPVRSWQFILGKYLGLALSLMIAVLLMGAFQALILIGLNPDHHAESALLPVLMLLYLEVLLVTAWATFFSTFTSPLMSVIFTVAVWVVEHMSPSLLELAKLSDNEFFKLIFQGIFSVLPDLGALTRLQGDFLHSQSADWQAVIYLVTYIGAYIILLLFLASLITENREYA